MARDRGEVVRRVVEYGQTLARAATGDAYGLRGAASASWRRVRGRHRRSKPLPGGGGRRCGAAAWQPDCTICGGASVLAPRC